MSVGLVAVRIDLDNFRNIVADGADMVISREFICFGICACS
jgi:hypothetical protein